MVPNTPSASVFNQQRAKLKPEALEAAFYQFNSSVLAREKTQTIVALPWMALPLLFSANLLFHLPNILFPRGIPWRDFIVCTWMHCDQSAYRGISLWTHQTSIRRQMGHRGIFPQAEIYNRAEQLSFPQTRLHQTGNMGKADCIQHDRNTHQSNNPKKGKH